MYKNRILAVLAWAFCAFSAVSQASPVVYDFTATLNQPIDGSNQVSGSFAVESADPGVDQQLGHVDVSLHYYPLTLDFAHQTIAVANVTDLGEALIKNSPGDFVLINGDVGTSQNSFGAPFLFSFFFQDWSGTIPATPGTPLPSLNLTNWTGTFTFREETPNGLTTFGTITSLQLDPNQPDPNLVPPSVPEPSALVVFALLGVGAIAFRRRAVRGAFPLHR